MYLEFASRKEWIIDVELTGWPIQNSRTPSRRGGKGGRKTSFVAETDSEDFYSLFSMGSYGPDVWSTVRGWTISLDIKFYTTPPRCLSSFISIFIFQLDVTLLWHTTCGKTREPYKDECWRSLLDITYTPHTIVVRATYLLCHVQGPPRTLDEKSCGTLVQLLEPYRGSVWLRWRKTVYNGGPSLTQICDSLSLTQMWVFPFTIWPTKWVCDTNFIFLHNLF